MFDSIFPKHWTTLQRLMWLKTNALARAVYEIVTGNPVSFTAKAAPLKQLEVAFSPAQDLHGYDAPWPAGGHYNQWDEEWEVGAYNASGTPSPVTDRMRCKNKIPVIGGAKYRYISSHGTYFFVAFFESDMTPLQTTVQMNPINTEITAPATAAFMLFYTDAAYGATYLHDIAINYPSSVTTYSPYSNICPISGHTDADVTRTGKNLCCGVLSKAFTVAGGEILSSAGTCLLFMCKKGVTYTYSGVENNRNVFAIFDAPPEVGSVAKSFVQNASLSDYTYTATSDGYGLIYVANSAIDTSEAQIELGSTATDYEPYQGTTYPISLGQTVYSGYVDVVTGVVTVDMAEVVFNGAASESWQKSGTALNGFYIAPTGKIREGKIYCTVAKQTPYVDTYRNNYNYCFSDSTFSVNLDPAVVGNTVEDFKAWLGNNPMTVCYELATPITIQLTPQEVQSLAGDNTMWSNANQPITVEYRKN